MNELELSDREDIARLTTVTSPHRQLSRNGAYYNHRKITLRSMRTEDEPSLVKEIILQSYSFAATSVK